jgi:hypothetical protein
MPLTNQKNCITPLNLPPRELPIRRDAEGNLRVFDPLRRIEVILTPEEWVRQHFVAHLVKDLGYPAGLIGNEVGISLNGLRRRCDSVVWSSADGSPLMLIEYKAPSVKISQKVFEQIIRYNMVFHAPYLIVSNGLTHYCCKVDCTTGKYTFLAEVPLYCNL